MGSKKPRIAAFNLESGLRLLKNQIVELRDKRANGTLIKDLMAEFCLSKATIYRYLSEKEA